MKTFIIVTLLIIFFRLTGYTQNECGVFIDTDFSSECLLTEYDRQKPKPLEDETVCFHACKGELVHYYAEGMNNAV